MPGLPPTRASLLLRVRHAADAPAWAEFVAVYGPAVFGYFRRRGLQDADAADLTQDVFRAVTQAMARFEYQPGRGRFRAWLFTVVSREFVRFRAAQKRLPVAADLGDVPAAEADADALWEESVRAQLFERALGVVAQQVSAQTLAAFTLTAREGLSGDAAAERLGLTRAAVYLARGRVLARLRAVVADWDAREESQ